MIHHKIKFLVLHYVYNLFIDILYKKSIFKNLKQIKVFLIL
jgi:hypothetical protein